MSYILNTSNENISPFDIGKISGTTNPTFNTFNVNWLSMNGDNIDSDDDISYYSEACFSADTNTYGIARITYSGNTSNYHLMGCQLPESSYTSVGGVSRGDDIAIHFGNSHYPNYSVAASMTTSQDVARANLKIIKIEI